MSATAPRRRLSTGAALLLATGGLVALFLLSLTLGKYPVSTAEVARVLLGQGEVAPQVGTVVLDIRLPRALAAALVGAALAAAGATYQGMFRNPLVSPDILGVSSGAGLGAVIAIFFSLPVIAIQGAAFLFGLLAVFLVYSIASAVRGTHDPILVLVLAGVVLGTLFSASISLLTYLADPYEQLPAITFWLLGSLASAKLADVGLVAPAILVGLVPMVLLRWRINLMSLGEDEARTLGVETGPLRLLVVSAATLITASAVSIAGVVGWVGLVVPHLARLIVGPNYLRLLPASMIIGAGYLLAVDNVARTLASIEIPLGVLNAFVGAPVFLWVLARARRSWT